MPTHPAADAPDLRNMTPVRCTECGGRAQLTAQNPNAFVLGSGQIWTYQCENCGHIMYRDAD